MTVEATGLTAASWNWMQPKNLPRGRAGKQNWVAQVAIGKSFHLSVAQEEGKSCEVRDFQSQQTTGKGPPHMLAITGNAALVRAHPWRAIVYND